MGNGKGGMEGGSMGVYKLRRPFSLKLGYLHPRKLLKLDILFLDMLLKNSLDDQVKEYTLFVNIVFRLLLFPAYSIV